MELIDVHLSTTVEESYHMKEEKMKQRKKDVLMIVNARVFRVIKRNVVSERRQ